MKYFELMRRHAGQWSPEGLIVGGVDLDDAWATVHHLFGRYLRTEMHGFHWRYWLREVGV